MSKSMPLLLTACVATVLTRGVYAVFVMPFPFPTVLATVGLLLLILSAASRNPRRLLTAIPFLLLALAVLYPTGFFEWCEEFYAAYVYWMWNVEPHTGFETLTAVMVTFAVTLPVFILIRCHSPAPILLFAGGSLFFTLENAGYDYPVILFWIFLLCVLLQMVLYAEPRRHAVQNSRQPKDPPPFTGARLAMVLPFCLIILTAAGVFAGSGADPLRAVRDWGYNLFTGWTFGVGGPVAGPGYATDITDIGSTLGGSFRPSGAVMLALDGFTIEETSELDGNGRGYVFRVSKQNDPQAAINGLTENSPDSIINIVTLFNAPIEEAPYLRGGVGSYYDGRRWSGGGDEGLLLDRSGLTETTLPGHTQYELRYLAYRGQKLYLPYHASPSVPLSHRYFPDGTFMLEEPPYENFRYSGQVPPTPPDTAYPTPDAAYRQLPATLPQRVRGLARRLAVYEEDYYNALAIERHLVEYFTYNPDMPPTPEGEDFVDYFLNEQGEGHCVYFASAMTVLCRAAGLPARYVEGFAPASERNGNGEFLYTDEIAHAWCEVYLGEGYGWVQFEPTPGYNRAELPVWFPEPILVEPVAPNLPEPSPSPSPTPGMAGTAPIAAEELPFPWVPLFLITLPPLVPIIAWAVLRRRRRKFIRSLMSLPYSGRQARRVYKHILWLESHAGLVPKPTETLGEFGDRSDESWPTKARVGRRFAETYGKVLYGSAPLTVEESEILRDHAWLLEWRDRINLSRWRLYLYTKILSLL
ncbi:MAG: DUF4129 domain-containing protein [Oscillospiraceae bacterium]|jgi:transglutaminase-like putative cysteine protease|nr:DUF4129 domain-containing protein [Oscillospiraceae bacterium]